MPDDTDAEFIDITSNKEAEQVISIQSSIVPNINLAFQQNAFPIIREIEISNDTDFDLDDIELSVQSNPDFLIDRIWPIDKLRSDSELNLNDTHIEIKSEYLREITESLPGEIIFSIKQNDNIFLQKKEKIRLLPKNEWGGIDNSPEILAAFVQPNDPAVQTILRNASKILENTNHSKSIDGYQSNSPKRVGILASAIWTAICKLDITYVPPPASFETLGQKVRLPNTIYEQRLATCLDLSLLFSSCLEQAGLNSLIILTKDHAFVGCWLQDEDFSFVTIDDASALRKRIELKELIVFETTQATHSPPGKFSFAMQTGKQHLNDDNQFHLAIDIKRARLNSIRPISDRDFYSRNETAVEADEITVNIDIPEDLPEVNYNQPTETLIAEDTPEGRIDKWKKQLLDLTLRNRLLNFTTRTRSIELECNDGPKLEDMLADGATFKILSADEINIDNDLRSQEIHIQQQQEDLRKERIARHLERKELVSKVDSAKLNTDLLELYRKARSAIQEGGSNILFISIGLLSWKQANNSNRDLKAPLILVPIELTRKSVNSGFRIHSQDDETRFNPTLLEILKRDFGLRIPQLENELPTDNSGIDVELIWNLLRREIRDIPGWELEEKIYISTFSFSKYLMWVDLCERVEFLKQSPIVKHLIDNPRDPFNDPSGESFPKTETLDKQFHPKDTFVPMPADSSQMSAIYAAESGKNYVLIGPPGTGKSQTITNIIAHLLAKNKTILFVSEKTAALEVVYRRLNEIGLGEHCLELHSSKAKKNEVIRQLGAAWDIANSSVRNWKIESQRLYDLKNELNSYVDQLHLIYPNGMTPYQAMGVVIRDKEIPPIQLNWPSYDTHNINDFDNLKDIVKRIDINSKEVNGIANNPLKEISTGEWSPNWEVSLINAAEDLNSHAIKLKKSLTKFFNSSNLNISTHTYSQLEKLKSLIKLLIDSHSEDYSFSLSDKGTKYLKNLNQASDNIQEFRNTLKKTNFTYKKSILTAPLEDIKYELEESDDKFFIIKFLKRLSIKKDFKKYLKDKNNKLDIDLLKEDLDILIKADGIKNEVDKFEYLSGVIDEHWRGVNSDLKWIQKSMHWSENILAQIAQISTSPDDSINLKKSIQSLVRDHNDLLSESSIIGSSGTELINLLNVFTDKINSLVNVINYPNTELFDTEPGNDYFQNLDGKTKEWKSKRNKLRYWCAWRKVRTEAIHAGLLPIINAIEKHITPGVDLLDLFLVNYSRWWINNVIEHNEILKNFIPAEHRKKIDDFQNLDEQFLKLTKQYIKAKLSSEVPDKNEVIRNSEWGILAREIQKRSRHMPIRQIMAKMPEAISELTPCIMMSPMSIAQYLPPDGKLYDVVIFDEASQIRVCDAVGAIARAKQAIIVGDPKQLPPTSFFSRREDTESDYDEDFDDDLESILDECLAANIPEMNLKWHYRSKCESLITFSNHRYYNGSLITFPNNDTKGMSVHYHKMDSVYREGNNRINRGEAEAIVSHIVEKLKDTEFNKSVGVVTFNIEQQNLISDLFEKAITDNPEIEHHFSEDNFKSIFVKNLESVQGDERDHIYFSITFGKDAAGRISMNLGPMNKSGGSRRLNVAVTRSIEEMHVFSSLQPEQIDLSRTSAEGVRDLKHFLEYAKRGKRALIEATDVPGGYYDSPFEQAVSEKLQNKGWIVHPQVGVSGFRIDLGIVNPNLPGKYICGIECDGATYHRSATARDRDLLREQILKDLGWNIIRIWSTDWWIDSNTAVNKVDKQLKELLNVST